MSDSVFEYTYSQLVEYMTRNPGQVHVPIFDVKDYEVLDSVDGVIYCMRVNHKDRWHIQTHFTYAEVFEPGETEPYQYHWFDQGEEPEWLIENFAVARMQASL